MTNSTTKLAPRKNQSIRPQRKARRNMSAMVEHQPNAIPRERGATAAARTTKKQICLELLNRSDGASICELEQATGWQSHSVRGFLSGEVRKRMNRQLTSETGEDGERRYRIVESEATS